MLPVLVFLFVSFQLIGITMFSLTRNFLAFRFESYTVLV